MINDIVNGISSSLFAGFGAGYKIYTQMVEQGLAEPCFFIKVLNVSIDRIRNERYQLAVNIDVHYFPLAKGDYADIYNVLTQMHSVLKRIALLNGDVLNGFDVSWECVDGVGHFMVSYKPFVLYPELPAELMGSLDIKEYTR